MLESLSNPHIGLLDKSYHSGEKQMETFETALVSWTKTVN